MTREQRRQLRLSDVRYPRPFPKLLAYTRGTSANPTAGRRRPDFLVRLLGFWRIKR